MLTYANVWQDIPFSEESMAQMPNSELADALGNLMHRATNITQKYCGGKVPEVKAECSFDTLGLMAQSSAAYKTFCLQDACMTVMTAVKDTNKYLTELAPWHIKAKDGEMTEEQADLKRQVIGHVCNDSILCATTLFEAIYLDVAHVCWRMLTYADVC